jgi:hypothetical protein
MDTTAYLLARNQTLARDSFMRRLRTEYAARRSADVAAQRQAESAGGATRFAPSGGWPAPTGCDCAECRALARRGLLEGLPRREITRAW